MLVRPIDKTFYMSVAYNAVTRYSIFNLPQNAKNCTEAHLSWTKPVELFRRICNRCLLLPWALRKL